MTLFESVPNRRYIGGQIAWFVLWAIVTGIGIALHPDPAGHGTHQHLGFPPCPSVLLFDRPCPGCGLTTSWTALLHGQMGFAFHSHPLGPALYLLFTASAWLSLYGWFKSWRFMTDSVFASRLLTAVAAVVIVFGAVRMAVTPHYRTRSEQMWASATRGQ